MSGSINDHSKSYDAYVILFEMLWIMHIITSLTFLFYLEKQVSEEVERALTKLGPAKLAGRYIPLQYIVASLFSSFPSMIVKNSDSFFNFALSDLSEVTG